MAVGIGYSVKAPEVVTRPIWFLPFSVNQRAPSGPTVMSWGVELVVGGGNSVTTPVGVMRPILPVSSVNQRFPSGPSATPCGSAVLPIGYSFTPWLRATAGTMPSAATIRARTTAAAFGRGKTRPRGSRRSVATEEDDGMCAERPIIGRPAPQRSPE